MKVSTCLLCSGGRDVRVSATRGCHQVSHVVRRLSEENAPYDGQLRHCPVSLACHGQTPTVLIQRQSLSGLTSLATSLLPDKHKLIIVYRMREKGCAENIVKISHYSRLGSEVLVSASYQKSPASRGSWGSKLQLLEPVRVRSTC